MDKYTHQYQLYFGHSDPVTGLGYSLRSISNWCVNNVTPIFPCFTTIIGEGYWMGESEQVTILTVLGVADDRQKMLAIATQYKIDFKQEAVLLTTTELKGELV